MPDPGDASQRNQTDEQGVFDQILTLFAALKVLKRDPTFEENVIHFKLSLPGPFLALIPPRIFFGIGET
jgi:hypothetical protein